MTEQQAEQMFVDQVAERIATITGAEHTAVVFGEDDNNAIHFAGAAGGLSQRLRGARGPAEGSGLCGNALTGNCSIRAATAEGDERVDQAHVTEMGIETALGVPVHHDGRPFAVLMALNRRDGGRFEPAHETALEDYSNEIADELWTVAREWS